MLSLVLAAPAGAAGLAAAAVGLGVGAALAGFDRVWFGGFTGDLLGAAAKLAETAALVAALVVLA